MHWRRALGDLPQEAVRATDGWVGAAPEGFSSQITPLSLQITLLLPIYRSSGFFKRGTRNCGLALATMSDKSHRPEDGGVVFFCFVVLVGGGWLLSLGLKLLLV